MMFGLGDEFHYAECSRCGCLQISTPPADSSRFYPDAYYSFQPRAEGTMVRWLKRLRLRHAFGRRSVRGALLVRWFGLPPDIAAVRRAGARFTDAILDIGCGDGRLLRDLEEVGFVDLTGIDPYMPQDPAPGTGVVLRRASVSEIEGSFDLVLMNHAFEHMLDPEATLRHVHRVLRPGGQALVRIPVADSYAWRHYRTDWVQLDAPRHLFLHTRQTIAELADRSGFRIHSVDYDSTTFQFWGSEQYRLGLALRGATGSGDRPRRGVFSRKQLREFATRAAELNRKGEGDQACFRLVKQ